MAESSGSVSVGVRCPRCGNEDRHELGWYRERTQTFCSACGTTIPINREKLIRFLRDPGQDAAPVRDAGPRTQGQTTSHRPRDRDRRAVLGIVAAAAAIATLAWIGAWYSSPGAPRPNAPTPSAGLFDDLIPVKPGATTTATPVPTCATPPANGAVLLFGLPLVNESGAHRLTIENGSAGDAIVILRIAQTNEFAGEFFVAKDNTAVIDALPDGAYHVEWAIGGLLAVDCRRFVRTEGANEFDDVMDFRTRYAGGYKYTANDRLTLFAVPGGNADSHAIDVKDFYPR